MIIAKMMARQLAPKVNDLISQYESAFINKSSIHNNFIFVRNYVRSLHQEKTSTLIFKLDNKKFFNLISTLGLPCWAPSAPLVRRQIP
jgi:hypothetical protein